MATGQDTWFDSGGEAVTVTLTSSVLGNNQVVYVEGWLGLSNRAGDSGDQIALTIDHNVYQFSVPAGLSVSKGDSVYVDVTDVTGHIPDDTAYSTTGGANKVALFKAVSDKDATSHMVLGILLPEGV